MLVRSQLLIIQSHVYLAVQHTDTALVFFLASFLSYLCLPLPP